MRRAPKIPDKITVGRLRTREKFPYFTAMLMSLFPVESPGLGTVAVDRFGRLYWDPDFLAKTSDADMVPVLLHETLHLYLRHHQRLLEALEDPFLAKCAELGKECAVNTIITQSGLTCGKDWVTPERFGLPPGLVTEQYYHRLQEILKRDGQQQPKGGKGSEQGAGPGRNQAGGGQGGRENDGDSATPSPQDHGHQQQTGGPRKSDTEDSRGPDRSQGQGGSAHDGRQRPWEEGPPPDRSQTPIPGQDQAPPGYDPGELEVLIEHASQQIEEHERQKGRGSVPGSLSRYAKGILHPTVSPVTRLSSMLRHSLSTSPGFGLFTYRKPSRRQPPGGAILPRHQRPVPDLLFIGDTSGSMHQRDLALVLGTVADVARSLCIRLEVWTGDTHVASVQKVLRPEEIHLVGGGGIDMRAMILAAMERRPRPPEVILVATDGLTPWPQKPVEAKVMACLTRKSRAHRVPAWIQTVVLRPEDED